MTKQFSNYSDLLTFTRASKGHALRPVSYGDEIVVNGTFDTDVSGWSSAINSTATATSGELVVTGVSASGRQVASISTTVGQVYRLTGEARVSTGSGTALLAVSDTTGGLAERGFVTTAETTATNLQLSFVATQSTHYVTAGNGSSGTGDKIFDNISIKEVLFDQPDGTLTLFEHPVNVPRVEWDSAGNRLGLLVEEARTNLFNYSEDFNSWGKIRATVNTNVIQAPDGTTTGDALVATAVNDDHAVEKSISATVQPYTFTAFIKAGNKSFVRLWQTNDDIRADFDLTDLTVGNTFGSPTATSIEDVGNGWRRCSITLTATAGTRTFRIYALEADNDKVYLGDGSTEDIYIWGAQLEAGSFPTSYIKTTGATATRSADVASIPVSDFGFNADAGTAFVDFSSFNNYTDTPYPRALGLRRTTGLRTGVEVMVFNERTHGLVIDNNVTSMSATVLGKEHKVGIAFKENNFAMSFSGSAATEDTSGTMPQGINNLDVGTFGISYLNGHIKSIKYYPRRLTNAQLVELTS